MVSDGLERATVCRREVEVYFSGIFAQSRQQTVSSFFAPTGQVRAFTISDAYNALEAVTQAMAAGAGTGPIGSTIKM